MSYRSKKRPSKKRGDHKSEPLGEKVKSQILPVDQIDGVEQARIRRLQRIGVEPPGRCALLAIDLDTGSRSNTWHRPVDMDGVWVSEIGRAIMASGVSPDDLEIAVSLMRLRDGE